ncbi:hypothetical protein LshimejAT787_0503790 [Lyophyllum shimeji]|uniref:Uncharacterized protein n=1 Tax=Lyophyllum shimeji TaxID=47721 RepID=A0A9P3UKU3_LYOSH|nr:hypothetical protein LshimejAT787_0503790 [Lyophyllum shimeji]
MYRMILYAKIFPAQRYEENEDEPDPALWQQEVSRRKGLLEELSSPDQRELHIVRIFVCELMKSKHLKMQSVFFFGATPSLGVYSRPAETTWNDNSVRSDKDICRKCNNQWFLTSGTKPNGAIRRVFRLH